MKLIILVAALFASASLHAEDLIDLNPHTKDGKVVLSYPVDRKRFMAQPTWIPGKDKCPLSPESACDKAISWIKAKYPELTLWVYQVDLRGDLIEKHKWHYEISFRGFPDKIAFGTDITEVIVLLDGSIVEPRQN